MLQLASLFTTLFLLLFFLLTPFIIPEWHMTPQHFLFLPAALFSLVISQLYARKKEKNHKVITVLCLFYEIVTLTFVIFIDIFTDPEAPGSFFAPLAVAFPAMFIFPLRVSYLLLFLSDAAYIFLAFSFKTYFIAQYDIFASIVGIAFSLVISHTILHLRSNDFDLRLKYQHLSQQDFLAGILNKQAFEEAGRNFLKSHSASKDCALLLFDLDDFKSINDTLGHYIGDQLLQEVGSFLPHIFNATDIVGRFGGDEFVILLKGLITQEVLENKCRLIQQQLASIKLRGLDREITCSIGGVISMKPQVTYEELFIKADNALYIAKKMGKNNFHLK